MCTKINTIRNADVSTLKLMFPYFSVANKPTDKLLQPTIPGKPILVIQVWNSKN